MSYPVETRSLAANAAPPRRTVNGFFSTITALAFEDGPLPSTADEAIRWIAVLSKWKRDEPERAATYSTAIKKLIEYLEA